MASIGPVTLTITRNVANAVSTVTYTLTGSNRDVVTQQPYRETCRLIGDDTPSEDGTDDIIPNGILKNSNTVFTGTAPITRTLTLTLPATALNEDVSPTFPIPLVDEIRAVVSLTPIAATASTRESNQVLFNDSGQFENESATKNQPSA
jgi:hypothetical protein